MSRQIQVTFDPGYDRPVGNRLQRDGELVGPFHDASVMGTPARSVSPCARKSTQNDLRTVTFS